MDPTDGAWLEEYHRLTGAPRLFEPAAGAELPPDHPIPNWRYELRRRFTIPENRVPLRDTDLARREAYARWNQRSSS